MHNTFGGLGVKLSVGNVNFAHYDIGDTIDIPDGVYIAMEGVVVVLGGAFIAQLPLNNVRDSRGKVMAFTS